MTSTIAGTVTKFFIFDVADSFDLAAVQVLHAGVGWHEDPQLAAAAEAACRSLLARLPAEMTRPRADFLSEDYLVFTVTGLAENVRDKLKTLDDINRFAVEQTAMARGELLELAIVLILVFELALFLAGVMR